MKLRTTMDKAGIVLNRMYVGDYLSTNLGHEVINLFKADNGNHYVYLNSTGNFASVHKGKIGYMLFVKYHKEDEMEVIGMATELKEVVGSDQSLGQNYKTLNKTIHAAQKEFIENEPDGGVKYDGVSILDIFNNAEQQSIFITYKAGKVYKPVKELRIFLQCEIVIIAYDLILSVLAISKKNTQLFYRFIYLARLVCNKNALLFCIVKDVKY